MTKTNSHTDKIKSILPNLVEWINLFSTIFLVTTLILPFIYQRIALYTFFISTILDVIINQRYTNLKWNKIKWLFIIMIVFYLCIWIWHIFEESNLRHFQKVTENRLPFLAFGILGLFCNINPKLKPQYLAFPMLLTAILSSSFILINIIKNSPSSFIEYQQLFEYYRYTTLKTLHMNFNLYLNFSIMFGFYALTTTSKRWIKIALLICICIIFLFIFTSEGRIGFFTGTILMIGFICYNIIKYNKKLAAPIITLSCILFPYLILNHQRVKNSDISLDPRHVIWEHSINLIKEKPLLGYGVSDGRKAFIEHRTENEKFSTYYLNDLYSIEPDLKNTYVPHPHNVFIESTIEFGIIGLILICSIMILPIVLTKGKKQLFSIITIFIFGVQAMFEVLWVLFPPIYLCLFLYIIILIPTDEKIK